MIYALILMMLGLVWAINKDCKQDKKDDKMIDFVAGKMILKDM